MTLQDAERMAREFGLTTSEKDMTRFITYHALYMELEGDTGYTDFFAHDIEPLRSFRTLLAPHFPGAQLVLHRIHKEIARVED